MTEETKTIAEWDAEIDRLEGELQKEKEGRQIALDNRRSELLKTFDESAKSEGFPEGVIELLKPDDMRRYLKEHGHCTEGEEREVDPEKEKRKSGFEKLTPEKRIAIGRKRHELRDVDDVTQKKKIRELADEYGISTHHVGFCYTAFQRSESEPSDGETAEEEAPSS